MRRAKCRSTPTFSGSSQIRWLAFSFVSDGTGESTLGLRERKKLRTRATLIDAAVALCGRHGFDNTTVDQIAAIADVSPRTFSRYFPTKEAIALALVDEVLDQTAVELARQPAQLNHFEALLGAYVAMAHAAKRASAGELSAERVLCIVRIILSSATLRQATVEFRGNAIDTELARRMAVGPSDRRVKLASATWGAVIMTALADLAPADQDWSGVGIDDLIAQLQATFAEFSGLTTGLPRPV